MSEIAAQPPAPSDDQPLLPDWPDWLVPPGDGFVAEDLDRLPGLPPHTELCNGSLVFAARQSAWHGRVAYYLRTVLGHTAPRSCRTVSRTPLRLDARNRAEPDVLVVTAEAYEREQPAGWYAPEDVRLVVEVVSPDSLERDREVKPGKYAKAGIPHFWRVEEDRRVPVVYVYELDPATRAYALTGIHRDRVIVGAPFPVNVTTAEGVEGAAGPSGETPRADDPMAESGAALEGRRRP